MTNVICFAQRASNSVDVLVSPLPSVFSVDEENDGNDLMYRRTEGGSRNITKQECKVISDKMSCTVGHSQPSSLSFQQLF